MKLTITQHPKNRGDKVVVKLNYDGKPELEKGSTIVLTASSVNKALIDSQKLSLDWLKLDFKRTDGAENALSADAAGDLAIRVYDPQEALQAEVRFGFDCGNEKPAPRAVKAVPAPSVAKPAPEPAKKTEAAPTPAKAAGRGERGKKSFNATSDPNVPVKDNPALKPTEKEIAAVNKVVDALNGKPAKKPAEPVTVPAAKPADEKPANGKGKIDAFFAAPVAGRGQRGRK